MIDYENPGFTLDLKFLLYGTEIYPLSTLTAYERYLIYMTYTEGKTLKEVAKVVRKHHITVKRQLRAIRNNLRRLSDEEENSG